MKIRTIPVAMIALFLVFGNVGQEVLLAATQSPLANVEQDRLQVLLEARPPVGLAMNPELLELDRTTIERRLLRLGLDDAVIETRGDNQILVTVSLNSSQEAEKMVDVLSQTGLLEIIDTAGEYLVVGTTVVTSLGEVWGTNSDSADYSTVVSGPDIFEAYPETDQNGNPVVIIVLRMDAAERLYDFTSVNVGQPMSIVLDKRVIATATIRNAIAGDVQISGLDDREVEILTSVLWAGSLAVPLEVVSSSTI